MSTIKKVLIPFDFSEASVTALEYGLSFAGYQNAIEIIAVYACNTSFTEIDVKEAEVNFRNTVAKFNVKLKIQPAFRMVEGPMLQTVLNLQQTTQANLIIMGTMGDKSLDEHVTNTSNLVLEADCPVISVPFGLEGKQPKEIALVLGKEEIEEPKVLDFLLDIARTFNAQVHVLTIYSESIYEEQVEVETNEESLEYYLEHFYAEHSFEKNQDIEQGIYDYIEEKGIDLLAIIPRNHSQKTKASQGRLTKLLTLHSSVPVLTLD